VRIIDSPVYRYIKRKTTRVSIKIVHGTAYDKGLPEVDYWNCKIAGTRNNTRNNSGRTGSSIIWARKLREANNSYRFLARAVTTSLPFSVLPPPDPAPYTHTKGRRTSSFTQCLFSAMAHSDTPVNGDKSLRDSRYLCECPRINTAVAVERTTLVRVCNFNTDCYIICCKKLLIISELCQINLTKLNIQRKISLI